MCNIYRWGNLIYIINKNGSTSRVEKYRNMFRNIGILFYYIDRFI